MFFKTLVLTSILIFSIDGINKNSNITDYQMKLPFAKPGLRYWGYNEILLAGEDESLISLGIDLKTDNKILRNNLYYYLSNIGSMTQDGGFYQLEITNNDRIITPEKLRALENMLKNPNKWSAKELESAREILKKQKNKKVEERKIILSISEKKNGIIIGTVKSLTDNTTIFSYVGQ